jgi:uncharacterized protein (TIGR02266 family)
VAIDYPSFREHSRAPISAKVVVRFDDQPNEQRGFAVNVSEGGLFIELDEAKPVGTLLRFELELPTTAVVSGFAEVVWIRVRNESSVRRSGCGIQFRHLEPGGRERLRHAISEALAKESGDVRP